MLFCVFKVEPKKSINVKKSIKFIILTSSLTKACSLVSYVLSRWLF